MTTRCQDKYLMRLWERPQIATLQILYYMPDYRNLLQEFVWQTNDHVPDFPRIHRFLWYWKDNIDATIHSIEVSHIDLHGHTRYINGKDFRII